MLLSIGLAMLCPVLLSAQSWSDDMFSVKPDIINNTHVVHLPKNEKIIIELADVTDYDLIANLDSLVGMVWQDIAFYRDSILPTGSIRIDYTLKKESDDKMMRFRRHDADGNIFIMRGNRISRLKTEQDTIRLIYQKPLYEHDSRQHFYNFPLQVTFCLNNYTGLDTLLDQHGLLNAFVDSFRQDTLPRVYDPRIDYVKTEADFYPYRRVNRMVIDKVYMDRDQLRGKPRDPRKERLLMKANIGGALVANTLAPYADLGIQWNRVFSTVPYYNYNILRVFASSYYLFDKAANGDLSVRDNWFINALIGSIYPTGQEGWLGNEVCVGAGWLFRQSGSCFRNTTVKVFTEIKLNDGISLQPEVIATSNFTQFFPGITLKVF